MTDTKMPALPEYPQGLTDLGRALGDTPLAIYHRARADAWEAKCRVAVEALKDAQLHLSDCTWCMDDDDTISGIVHCCDRVDSALAAIGPLPLPTPLPGEGE